MNALEQVIQLTNKLQKLLNENRGALTLSFYDGNKITGNVKSVNTSFGMGQDDISTITMFKNNIDETTTYNLFDVKDVS